MPWWVTPFRNPFRRPLPQPEKAVGRHPCRMAFPIACVWTRRTPPPPPHRHRRTSKKEKVLLDALEVVGLGAGEGEDEGEEDRRWEEKWRQAEVLDLRKTSIPRKTPPQPLLPFM